MDLDKVYKECVRFGLAGEKSGWLEGVSRGIINIGTILAYINMKKEQKVLEVHTYAITKLEGGRNTTYVYDDTKKYHRRLVRAKNYKELIPFRAERAHAEHLNYGVPEWVYLFARSTSMRSIKLRCARMGINKLYDFYFSAEDIDNASYEKYVKGTRIDTLPLKSIKTIDLENWAIEVLLKYEMTAKNFNTHKLVVTGPLTYAKKGGYNRKSLKWTDINWKNETLFIQRMESEGKMEVELMKWCLFIDWKKQSLH